MPVPQNIESCKMCLKGVNAALNGIVGILLAAGQSRRFGSNKLLHLLPNRVPIVTQAMCQLQAAVPQVLVVSRPDATALNAVLAQTDVPVVNCETAARGMGASLACGVRASHTAQGWVVALADMPYLSLRTLQTVVAQLQQGAAIVAPTYQGKRGHPVGFSRQFLTELSQLDNDVGAKSILQRHQPSLTLFDSLDAGVLHDIDVLDDVDFAQTSTLSYK